MRLAAFLAAPMLLLGAGRQVGIVVDTSGSMVATDPPRYAVQITKILSDLLDDDDRLSVSRLPERPQLAGSGEDCASPPNPGLEARMNPSDRSGFKKRIDDMSDYNTALNAFAAAVHTVRQVIGSSGPRMLLFIADSGGFDHCESALARELSEMRASGVFVAAINLGRSTGSFGANPGIERATTAQDSEGLVKAVAGIYQRFLGAKKVQTGAVRGRVEVQVDPYVKEAFLVVASDGQIGDLRSEASNPGADSIEMNHRGGGETRGLDGRIRAYRIVRLRNPKQGRWIFHAPGLSGGFMLLQDYAVALRLVTRTVPAGGAVPMEWEVYDERTGRRIEDRAVLSGLQPEVELDGARVRLRDDGAGGDRRAGDGVFTTTHRFDQLGRRTIAGVVASDNLNRTFSVDFEVVEPGFKLTLASAAKVEIGKPVDLMVRATPSFPGAAASRYPEKVTASLPDGTAIELTSSGSGVYRAPWTPQRSGQWRVNFVAAGGARTEPLDAEIEVLGRITFGRAAPIRIGPVKSKSEGNGAIELTGATVTGDVKLKVTSDLSRRRIELEVETPSGWKRLDSSGAELTAKSGHAPRWNLRLRTGDCPATCRFDQPHTITLTAARADGSVDRLDAPLHVETVPDPLLYCWRYEIFLGILTLITAFIVYGFVRPYRFNARLGVQVSPEEDLSEGYFYNLRAQRGSRAGFYRDARLFVTEDFRVTGKSGNAFVRLRAFKGQVRIQPENGRSVWRQTADGSWEALPAEETATRPGTMYRNDQKTLFFDLRAR